MALEQESIWLNDQLQDGEQSRYLESWCHRLRGSVDIAAIEEALAGIVRRHESLRSRLMIYGGRPSQIVLRPTPVPVNRLTVADGGIAEALRWAVTRPVALDRPPLLRATLLELANDDAILAVSIHHAIIDGWCFRLLDLEFSELYRATIEGRSAHLPEVPVQCGMYAVRQRKALRSGGGDSINYWRSALSGAPRESSLPLNHARPSVLSSRGGQVSFKISEVVATQLLEFSRKVRTTPFVVMATALAVVMRGLSGQEDLVVGTPISRRDEADLEPMIACLTDVMPLRLRGTPSASFAELVSSTKARVWEAVRHRQVPFGHLVKELKSERSLARFPLFQVVLTVDDANAPGLSLPDISAQRLYVHSGRAKFDIFLNLIPQAHGYVGVVEYSKDLFERGAVVEFAQWYCALVAMATANPHSTAHELWTMLDATAVSSHEVVSTEDPVAIQGRVSR